MSRGIANHLLAITGLKYGGRNDAAEQTPNEIYGSASPPKTIEREAPSISYSTQIIAPGTGVGTSLPLRADSKSIERRSDKV